MDVTPDVYCGCCAWDRMSRMSYTRDGVLWRWSAGRLGGGRWDSSVLFLCALITHQHYCACVPFATRNTNTVVNTLRFVFAYFFPFAFLHLCTKNSKKDYFLSQCRRGETAFAFFHRGNANQSFAFFLHFAFAFDMQNSNFSSITGNRIEFLSIQQWTHFKVGITPCDWIRIPNGTIRSEP